MHLPDRQEGVAFKLRPETTTSAIFSRGARRSTAATTVGSSGDSMDSARRLRWPGRYQPSRALQIVCTSPFPALARLVVLRCAGKNP